MGGWGVASVVGGDKVRVITHMMLATSCGGVTGLVDVVPTSSRSILHDFI